MEFEGVGSVAMRGVPFEVLREVDECGRPLAAATLPQPRRPRDALAPPARLAGNFGQSLLTLMMTISSYSILDTRSGVAARRPIATNQRPT